MNVYNIFTVHGSRQKKRLAELVCLPYSMILLNLFVRILCKRKKRSSWWARDLSILYLTWPNNGLHLVRAERAHTFNSNLIAQELNFNFITRMANIDKYDELNFGVYIWTWNYSQFKNEVYWSICKTCVT